MDRRSFAPVFSLALLSLASLYGQSQPTGNWAIQCGLWRTDTSFNSTIQIKNRLVTEPVTVTPVLFMADGTEFDLPDVILPAAGVATVNVNSALANIQSAAAGITSHLSTYGSSALRFSGFPFAVIGQTTFGSPSLSLSYMARFTAVSNGPPAEQTLEGLWWARDAGVGGFVSLSNATAEPRSVSIQSVTATGQAQPAQSFTLAPHANQMLDLLSLIGPLVSAGEAGGLRVQFAGRMGEVNVTGGLENRQEGYSALMPFWMAPAAGETPGSVPITLGHAGIMVGAPDAMMGFPAGTRFAPYLALRNITGGAIAVNLTLYTEQGTPLPGPVQSLQPWESRQVDMGSLLQQIGLKDFSGMLTLAVSHTGQPNDIMSAAGSVDTRGTYVFEVEGRVAEETSSKQSPYWSVKDGNDTMMALWNPTGNAEDVMMTVHYAGGSGQYHFPIHLAPHATANLDMLELIADQSPDADGNVIPRGVPEGSFVFHSAAGVEKPVYLNANVGIFNVVKGTCYYGTIWCNGYTSLIISPGSTCVGVTQTTNLASKGQYSDGTTPGVQASWTSSNSSVASLTNNIDQGTVKGMGAGQATASASASLLAYGEYSGYNPSCQALQPYQNFGGGAPVTVATLTCSPTSVAWGATVSCTVGGASASQISAWTFSGQGLTAGGPAQTTTWSGMMVASGTISVTAAGTPLSQGITVSARTTFAEVTMPAPSQVANGSKVNSITLPTLKSPPTTAEGTFGASAYASGYSVSTEAVQSGPNTGIYYVSAFSDLSAYPWELNPGVTNSSDPFYQHQGPQGGSCWATIAQITSAVQAHEIGASSSHFAEVQAALASDNPATVVNAFLGSSNSTTQLDDSLNSVYQAAYNAGQPEPPTNLPTNINYAPYSTCP